MATGSYLSTSHQAAFSTSNSGDGNVLHAITGDGNGLAALATGTGAGFAVNGGNGALFKGPIPVSAGTLTRFR